MRTFLLPFVALAVSSPLAAQSIVVVTAPQADSASILPVAYAELRANRNEEAIAKLTGAENVDVRDPSRLINLGTAYARLERNREAAAMYKAAIASPIRYDLELSDGRTMDSRWAARAALAYLDQRRAQLALAH